MSCMEGRLEMEMAQVVSPLGVTLYSVDRKPGVLRVVLDKRGGVDLDRLEEASRLLSAFLDTSDTSNDKSYVLEVSSPGAERRISNPLQAECVIGLLVSVQFRSHPTSSSTGRDASVEKKDDSTIYGRLLSVEGNDIVVEQVDPSPKKTRNSKHGGSVEGVHIIRVTLDDDVVVRTVLEWREKEDVR